MIAPFEPKQWKLGQDRSLEIGAVGRLMGVLNVTPDSFSDGGLFEDPKIAKIHALKMVEQGAAIIDIGAESTKPGAVSVDGDQERARLLPVLEEIFGSASEVIVSVDTYRASTAKVALEAGAHIVNDVWGLQREPDIAHIAADYGCGVVIMHTNRERTALDDVIEDQKVYFAKSLEIAGKAGISDDQIMLDPGFGFGKETAALNFALMARFEELHTLGFPLLVGTSRKRFLGADIGLEPDARDTATAATTAILRQKGAAVFRVHELAGNAETLRICDAMLNHLR